MDANDNASANVNPFGAKRRLYAIENSRCIRVLDRVSAIIIAPNIIPALIPILILWDETSKGSYIVLHFAMAEFLVQLVSVTVIYHRVDRACYPIVMSWIAAFIVAAYGALYPYYLHSSKLLWVMIIGWVMFALSVLATGLQYSFYLAIKNFDHKSVHPLPAPADDV